MIYIITAKNLPVYCIFVVPIAMEILLSFLFTVLSRRMVYWSTVLSLAL